VNDSPLATLADLPAPMARAVEKTCTQFEESWAAGRRPSLEECLSKALPESRGVLLAELLRVELAYRIGAGERPELAEYLGRLPQYSGLVEVLYTKALAGASAALSTRPPSSASQSSQARTPDIAGNTPWVFSASPQFGQEPGAVPPTQGPEGRPPIDEAVSSVAVPGYEMLEVLGKGGMGVVYKARQVSLGRLVALKMILHGGHAGREERRRFRAEAEAVARLQHPNIVQVYEVGESQGLPYFSLEYCGGGSLADRLDGTPWQASPAAELVQKLSRAMVAAHAAGIVHRDLKPANVLLTADGTPKVTDFGLAKRLDQEGRTQTGAIVGTPSYMAPEQASGEKSVGPGADVYALGAILYELLTGRPPFKAATPLDTVQQVVHDEPVPVRRLQPKVPRDLQTVCHKCLEKDPRKRFSSAEALAEDLRRFGAGEPVAARPVGTVGRVARWARRRPAVAALLGLVALLAIGGVGGILWAYGETVREKKRTEGALAAESQARQRTRAALDDMSSQVIADWLTQRTQLEPVQRAFLEKALAHYEAFAAESGNTQEVRKSVADAHLRIGHLRDKLGQHAEAEAAYRRAQELCASLVADFPTVPQYRQDLATSHVSLGLLWSNMGRLKEAQAAYTDALDIRKRLADDFPTVPQYRQDLAISHSNIGSLLSETGHAKEAEAVYRDILDIRKQLVADFPTVPDYRDELAGSHYNLGNLLSKMGRAKEAETAYRETLEIRRRLVADCPTVPGYRRYLALGHVNLGLLLVDMGRPKEAEAAYTEALSLQKGLTADFPSVPIYRRDLAISYNNLGVLLKTLGRTSEAEAAYRDALAIRKPLAADFPLVPLYRQELASSYNNLGLLLADTGRLKEAEPAYREALALKQQLAADIPRVPQYRLELTRTQANLGNLLRALGRTKEAEAACRDALDILNKLVADFPKVPNYRAGLGNTMDGLAELARDRKDYLAARQLLEQAHVHLRVALDAYPRHPFFREFCRENRQLLATTLVDLGEHAAAALAADDLARIALDPALDSYNAACYLSRCVTLAEKDAKLPQVRREELAKSYGDRAIELLRQAIARGYKDARHMKEDSDLEPLHSRADFQQLVAKLKAPPQG
jgi:tetratricopeptide (TPR) repeat protein